ncbi:Beta-glucosidase [Symbiodinium microadriaticum]|uniref:Beta-glucosidase n=1 Tax=Symbiodinium microadriaticum TaxID=2951 RepID=A0A1Q9DC74_SYMMI|nr:Beta-glucosidase [Symbiodinium microadriaticum]CAE7948313.1 cbg-1 [Symbiodinium sp. KB8]
MPAPFDISPLKNMADVAYKRIDEQTRETSLLGKSAATANGTDSINSMVRIIVVSDTHGLHETLKMPAGDVLVHCGDMADRGNVEHVRSCIRWLNSLPYKEIFVVDGNHDCSIPSKMAPGQAVLDMQAEFERLADHSKVKLLQDDSVLCHEGQLCIFGASWSSCEADDFAKMYQTQWPVDVMVAHHHPQLPSKALPSDLEPGAWQGSEALTRAVLKAHIPLCCFGHVHYGRGCVPLRRRGGLYSHFVNAANEKPGMKHKTASRKHALTPPVVIDYNITTRQVETVQCPSHRDAKSPQYAGSFDKSQLVRQASPKAATSTPIVIRVEPPEVAEKRSEGCRNGQPDFLRAAAAMQAVYDDTPGNHRIHQGLRFAAVLTAARMDAEAWVLDFPSHGLRRSALSTTEVGGSGKYSNGRGMVVEGCKVYDRDVVLLKHLVGNDQEADPWVDKFGCWGSGIWTFNRVYLQPFEAAIREADAQAVMPGYNRLNGTYCAENAKLLQATLRDTWGFKGLIVSDWWANRTTLKARNGEVSEKLLDERCRPLLRTLRRYPRPATLLNYKRNPLQTLVLQRIATAVKDAQVLLKNTGALPLQPAKLRRLALIGPAAAK